MTDHDLIREAREAKSDPQRFGRYYLQLARDLADALKASNARADQLEKALREAREWGRSVHLPRGERLKYILEEIDAALAGFPAEPATEEKP